MLQCHFARDGSRWWWSIVLFHRGVAVSPPALGLIHCGVTSSWERRFWNFVVSSGRFETRSFLFSLHQRTNFKRKTTRQKWTLRSSPWGAGGGGGLWENLQSIQLCVRETDEFFIGSLFRIYCASQWCMLSVHQDQVHVPKSLPDVE